MNRKGNKALAILIAGLILAGGAYILLRKPQPEQSSRRQENVRPDDAHLPPPGGTPIGSGFYKTVNGIFFLDYPLAGADVRTFKVLTPTLYAMDGKKVFYRGNEIAGADPASFAPILVGADGKELGYEGFDDATGESVREGVYAKDNYAVYRGGRKLPDLDPKTVVFYYANPGVDGPPLPLYKDKNAVYYQDRKLEGALPSNFKDVNGYYAKDERHVYYFGEIIQEADPATFVKINPPPDADGKILGYYRLWAQDKNSRYFQGKKTDAKPLETPWPAEQ